MSTFFIGKDMAVVKAVIRGLLCKNSNATNCDCDSCRIALEYHPDYLELTEGNKDAADMAVDFCREIPSLAPNKVVAFMDADKLNSSASNALLKSVEEGPGEFVFVGTKRGIPTLMSRCQVVTVDDTVSSSETYGLNPFAFRYATGRKSALIEEFAETDFFSFLNNMLQDLSSMKEKRELLKIFSLVKEKDTNEFFSSHSKNEVRGCLNLLSGVFFSLAMSDKNILNDYSNIEKLYDKKEAIKACEKISRFLTILDGNCSKNDFFLLIANLI